VNTFRPANWQLSSAQLRRCERTLSPTNTTSPLPPCARTCYAEAFTRCHLMHNIKCLPRLCHYILRDLQWTDEAESLRRLRSGSQQRLIVPRTRLRTIGDRSFHVTAARAWNSLPTSVNTAASLACFKKQLKTFLFTKSLPEF